MYVTGCPITVACVVADPELCRDCAILVPGSDLRTLAFRAMVSPYFNYIVLMAIFGNTITSAL